MDTRPIGMFDSGVGGLTVLKEVIEQNPNENIIYLGDTKRFPYGSKSRQSIIELTKNGIDFLITKDVKAIIIACGTATSQALKEVKKMYDIPIIGIIDSTVDYIKSKEELRNIGIIATAGTIRSRGWQKRLDREIENIKIYNRACPLLAPMAEEGWTNNEIAKLTVHKYLKDFPEIDALILGCTHYPLFKKLIEKELNESIEIINTGEILSKYLKEYLEKEQKQNKKDNVGNYEIYLTDTETNFVNVAEKLLKVPDLSEQIKKAHI